MTRGFHGREEYCSDFPCSPLLHCLVQHIFLVEKGKSELFFLNIEDFNFLWEVEECRIPLSWKQKSAERGICQTSRKGFKEFHALKKRF